MSEATGFICFDVYRLIFFCDIFYVINGVEAFIGAQGDRGCDVVKNVIEIGWQGLLDKFDFAFIGDI